LLVLRFARVWAWPVLVREDGTIIAGHGRIVHPLAVSVLRRAELGEVHGLAPDHEPIALLVLHDRDRGRADDREIFAHASISANGMIPFGKCWD
jgi:hypothetical protein